ncbi:MAG TPA: hypothetical protein VKS82_06840 [Streptosporangiaceae bacterium]|nr:hypothetical protein [Streptosporangiaceae bacterium]
MDPPDRGLATVAGPDKARVGVRAGTGGPRAGREPSWPRVLATTVHLWLKRRRLRSYLVAAAVLAVAAAVMSSVLAQGAPDGPARSRGTARAAGPAAVAADWVAGQVSHDASVACDPATCAILQQRGFPASNLVVLRAGTLNPRGASVIVATAGLRDELGSRLAASCAPVLLASFGAGSARTEIRAVAPDGPAAYLSQFRADAAARQAFGAELRLNPAVQASPLARQQLSGGQVDARLIATIAAMAALHPVRLVSFGDASPGASPGIPLRSAVLYGTDGTDATLDSLRAMLLAQHPLYRPASVQIVRLPAGGSALRIVFAAPSPLGLLDATQPLVTITPP